MAGDYTRSLWPVTTHAVSIPVTTYGVYSRRLYTVSMASDYARCRWPVTTHVVNGRGYTRCLWPVTTHGVYGR